jgi:uncharacterized protein YbjT (DUF2867 family)
MRIVVAGGTGVVGRHTVDAVRESGHEPVVLSRSNGVDLVTGTGLDAALIGADVVIDTSNVATLKAEDAIQFFTTVTANLVSAAQEVGIGHVVLLSIVGIDRMPHGYYAGKLAQEQVLESAPVPWTILRSTQFHDFAAQLFGNAKVGPFHVAPRARTQPVASREVGEHLAALATSAPQGRVSDLAGPREERLDEMIKAYARATGHRGWIPSINVPSAQMKGMRAGHGLPGPEAQLGRQTFSEWLEAR